MIAYIVLKAMPWSSIKVGDNEPAFITDDSPCRPVGFSPIYADLESLRHEFPGAPWVAVEIEEES